MYYSYSVLSAILIAFMVVVNGRLTGAYDIYSATVIIHIVGLVLISGIAAFKKERLFRIRGLPLTLFLGGAIGVVTTLFNNIAFGKISVSAIIALCLLGQTVSALVIDEFGLFNMPIKKFNVGNLAGLLFAVVGVIWLLSGFVFLLLPVIFSLLTGVSIVISRSVNALLAEKTSVITSTWYNYAVGLIVAWIIFSIAGSIGVSSIPTKVSANLWIYLGGAIGVFVVGLSNISTSKIPAFQMTLILFAGQMLTGLVLDILLSQAFSGRNLVGGILVTLGLYINLWLEKWQSKR
jgi:transporter family-2 protein